MGEGEGKQRTATVTTYLSNPLNYTEVVIRIAAH